MDVHIQLRKLDAKGKELSQINFPMAELANFGIKSANDVPWVNIVRCDSTELTSGAPPWSVGGSARVSQGDCAREEHRL
jgi:hypothetical protein